MNIKYTGGCFEGSSEIAKYSTAHKEGQPVTIELRAAKDPYLAFSKVEDLGQ